MSHFFGYVGNARQAGQPSFIPSYTYQHGNIGIYFPDDAKNLFYQFDPQSEIGVLAAGTLLKRQPNAYRLLDSEDVKRESFFHPVSADYLQNLQGHYVIATWDLNAQSISFTLDPLGIRPIYIYKKENHGNKNVGAKADPKKQVIYFSTRLDWLSKVMENPMLNISALGSFWYNINQITGSPFLEDVIAPDGGTQTTINVYGIRTEHLQKLNYKHTFNDAHFIKELQQISNPKTHLTNSISLSGGLDSRVILALRAAEDMGNEAAKIGTHSFGEKGDRDVHIARKISHLIDTNHREFGIEPLTFKNDARQIIDFVAQTQGTALCSESFLGDIMTRLNAEDLFITDGGFGEIHRRQFLEKLTFFKNDINKIQPKDLADALSREGASIFCPSFENQLRAQRKQGIWQKWQKACRLAENDIGKAADLFSLSTRVKNISRMNQGWFDAQITNYMPFIQPSVLESTLLIDTDLKKNVKLFKSIIRKHSDLHKIPLAKEGITYPFFLPSIIQKLLLKAQSYIRIRTTSEIGYQARFLNKNRDYVLDRLHAQQTRENEIYHYDHIYHTISSYYAGEYSNAQFVLAWLTFDIFNKELL